MFSLVISEHAFNFGSQTGENLCKWSYIITDTVLLIHQGNVYQCHQRYRVVTFALLVNLGIDIVPVGNELCGCTVVFLLGPVDYHLDFLVVNMQPYM